MDPQIRQKKHNPPVSIEERRAVEKREDEGGSDGQSCWEAELALQRVDNMNALLSMYHRIHDFERRSPKKPLE